MSEHDFDTQTQEEFIYDLYLTGYDTSQKMDNVKAVRSLYNQTVGGLKEAKDFAETASEKKPVLVASDLNQYQLYVNVAQLDAVNAIYIFKETNVSRQESRRYASFVTI